MGFGIRLSKNLRVSATSRGVRLEFGPRKARIHVGGGYRPTISSGRGRYTVWAPLTKSARPQSRPPARVGTHIPKMPDGPSAETLLRRENAAVTRSRLEQRRLQQTEHEQALAKSLAGLQALTRIHLLVAKQVVRPKVDEYGFLVAVPPVEEPEPVPPIHERAALLTEHFAQDSADLHFWQRDAHRGAEAQAQRETEKDIADHAAAEAERTHLLHERTIQHDNEVEEADTRAKGMAQTAQKQADIRWDLLLSNDPDTVLASVDHAYGDNNPHALAVECQGNTITAIATYQGIDFVLPAKQPYVTPGGKFSERAWSITARNEFYLSVIASDLLHVVRSTFAVAPKIMKVQIAGLREQSLGEAHVPRYRLDLIYRGRFSRCVGRCSLGQGGTGLNNQIGRRRRADDERQNPGTGTTGDRSSVEVVP